MSDWQCSMCFRKYTFNEFLALKSELISEKHKGLGNTSICICGARFDKERWCIQTKKDLYIISTIHLQTSALSTVDMMDAFSDFWFETMIFKQDQLKRIHDLGKPMDYQMRYKTMEEAIIGHKDTIDKLEMIILDPTKYPMGIIPRVCNMMSARNASQKVIKSDVKERLK